MTGNDLHERDLHERDLVAWLTATATPHTPDDTDDLVRRIVREPQRPGWSFPGRWLPVDPTSFVMAGSGSRSWRTIAVLALLLLLLLVSVGLYVGSRPRPAPPYVPWKNGLVAFVADGDIFTADPAGGPTRAVVTGPDVDSSPRWSLDGTRLAFLRATNGTSTPLVIVDADGAHPVVSEHGFDGIDIDSIAWSPDGRSVAIVADGGRGRSIYLIDTSDGAVGTAGDVSPDTEVYWRHDSGAILFTTGGKPFLITLADDRVEPMPAPPDASRIFGWTPDGRHVVYHTETEVSVTILVDVSTDTERRYEIGVGRVSNDGTWIAGLHPRDELQLCVVPIGDVGGPCTRIGTASQAFNWEQSRGLEWSPDDRWLLSRPESGPPPLLIDPGGAPVEQPDWLLQGVETWQRLPRQQGPSEP